MGWKDEGRVRKKEVEARGQEVDGLSQDFRKRKKEGSSNKSRIKEGKGRSEVVTREEIKRKEKV